MTNEERVNKILQEILEIPTGPDGNGEATKMVAGLALNNRQFFVGMMSLVAEIGARHTNLIDQLYEAVLIIKVKMLLGEFKP